MKIGMNTDFTSLSKIPLGLCILLAAILFTQAFWLFQDASKRNTNKWLWGLWGLIQAPTPLIVYLFAVRKILSRSTKEKKIRAILIAILVLITLLLILLGVITQ